MQKTIAFQRMNELAIEFGADVDPNDVAYFRKLPRVPLFVKWLEDRGETTIAELASGHPRYWFHRRPARVGHVEQ